MLDANTLKQFVSAVRAVADEVRVVNGEAVVVDPGNIALVRAVLPVNISFSADLSKLWNIVCKLKGDVQLDVKEDRLVIKSGNLRYSLEQLADVRKPPKIPKLKFITSAAVDGRELKRFLQMRIGDYVSLYSGEDGFFAEMKGDVERAVLTLSRGIYEEAKSRVNREFFEAMVKAAGDFPTISVGNDIPVKLEAEVDGVNVTYYLAPVVE